MRSRTTRPSKAIDLDRALEGLLDRRHPTIRVVALAHDVHLVDRRQHGPGEPHASFGKGRRITHNPNFLIQRVLWEAGAGRGVRFSFWAGRVAGAMVSMAWCAYHPFECDDERFLCEQGMIVVRVLVEKGEKGCVAEARRARSGSIESTVRVRRGRQAAKV